MGCGASSSSSTVAPEPPTSATAPSEILGSTGQATWSVQVNDTKLLTASNFPTLFETRQSRQQRETIKQSRLMLVEDTWNSVKASCPDFALRLYAALFKDTPAVAALFKGIHIFHDHELRSDILFYPQSECIATLQIALFFFSPYAAYGARRRHQGAGGPVHCHV